MRTRTKKPYSLAMLPATSLHSMLSDFSHQQLRTLAKRNSVRQGQNKTDTLRNLTSPEALDAFYRNGVTVTING